MECIPLCAGYEEHLLGGNAVVEHDRVIYRQRIRVGIVWREDNGRSRSICLYDTNYERKYYP